MASSPTSSQSSEFSSSENEDTLCAPSILQPLGQENSSLFRLPLEIRFEVYRYLLAPGKDGTCRAVYASKTGLNDEREWKLKGIQKDCPMCKNGVSCHSCIPKNPTFLIVSGGQRHTSILRSCRMILTEATPFFRATPLTITVRDITDDSNLEPSPAETLDLFLSTTGLPKGYCFPFFTLLLRPEHEDEDEWFQNMDEDGQIVRAINKAEVQIDHLKILTRYSERTSWDYSHDAEREVVLILDSFYDWPSKVTWKHINVHPKWDQDTARRAKVFFKAVNKHFADVIESGTSFGNCPAYRDFP